MIVNNSEKIWITEEFIDKYSKVDPATLGHYFNFGFMRPTIMSMLENVKILGQAVTVKLTTDDSVMVHEAVSNIRKNEILIIEKTEDTLHAPVGEMVVFTAKERGAAGIIIDGPCTDIQSIREMNFPVFATGRSPITTKLRGIDGEINTIIQCGGTVVKPGDFVIADDNGVLVLDRNNKNFEDYLNKALLNDERETELKKQIKAGKKLSELTNAKSMIE